MVKFPIEEMTFGPPSAKVPKIFTYEMRQDDPAKCTSAKLRRMGLAKGISKERIPRDSIVLNPSRQSSLLLPKDRLLAQMHGLVVIDCSWKKAEPIFGSGRFKGNQRKLPLLLAGNPTNYSKLGSMSSLEALGGALYIMGFKQECKTLLSIYKWGATFLSLNENLLEDYSNIETSAQMIEVERSYFPEFIGT